jgi:hypothetical protein
MLSSESQVDLVLLHDCHLHLLHAGKPVASAVMTFSLQARAIVGQQLGTIIAQRWYL